MVLAALCCGATATAREQVPMADPDAAAAQHRWHRFIVKYHPHTDAGQDAAAVLPRLARIANDAGLQPQGAQPPLRWERRLGVGADLVVAEPPLDHASAQRLLRTLAKDPDIEYAEPDGMMQRAPGPERGEPVAGGE
ncbi:hypothetical protein CO641_01340 [Lysobacteraceae bacterium NML91-0213]|nr:hypothetical protein CO641_01340 [Xanthomonadaceae bacterium NML91-0213]